MKIYVAAAYSRRAEAQRLAERICQRGHRVTATWLNGPAESEALDVSRTQLVRWGLRDMADIAKSDAMVVLTAPRDKPETSGHHWEAGYFAGLDGVSDLMVLGPPENVFYSLVRQFDTPEEFLAYLGTVREDKK